MQARAPEHNWRLLRRTQIKKPGCLYRGFATSALSVADISMRLIVDNSTSFIICLIFNWSDTLHSLTLNLGRNFEASSFGLPTLFINR